MMEQVTLVVKYKMKNITNYNLKLKLASFILLFILLATQVTTFTTNGSGKTFEFTITSGKNAELSGSDFKTYIIVGDITGLTNSSNFETELGFLRTTGYVTSEACEVNAQCTGGFCCSNACQSTACTVEDDDDTGTGAGSGAGGAGGGGGGCTYDWQCAEWSVCTEDGQTRTCANAGTCLGTFTKPIEVQECVYVSDEEEIPEEKIGAGKIVEEPEIGTEAEEDKINFFGKLAENIVAKTNKLGNLLFDYISIKAISGFVIAALLMILTTFLYRSYTTYELKRPEILQDKIHDLLYESYSNILGNKIYDAVKSYKKIIPIYIKFTQSEVDKEIKIEIYRRIKHLYRELQKIKKIIN